MYLFSKLGFILGMLTLSASLSAHTISIGYSSGSPGEATFWYGSYHESVDYNEGALNLVGITGNPFSSTTVNFSLLAYTQPTGLIDGVTNFYSNGDGDALLGSDLDDLGPVVSWQGSTFTGLSAGDYQFTYVPIQNPTNQWKPWGPSVLSNTITLSAADVSGGTQTPEPASMALLGSGLLILGGLYRRHTKATPKPKPIN